jgi:pimeloyl-ACP methyl ester carboxylesterase
LSSHDRPKLLLVPEFTEVELAIRPQLEEWAEVASYDPPGVGREPLEGGFGREGIVRRGLAEVDRRGWQRFFVLAEGWGISSGVAIAGERPDEVQGLALGHAKLSYRRDGPRAPVNGEVWEALTQLVRTDRRGFVRHGIAQATRGSIGEEQAERMLARIPEDRMEAGWEELTRDEPFSEMLLGLECPLLLAKHEGCLVSTEEGFDDAAAALPRARTIAVEIAPLASDDFAAAVRSLCEDVRRGTP